MVWRLVVGGAGMICAWFLIHTVLALHYAHLYYGDVTAGGKTVDRGGLDFPETKEPDYWDFFYYAFVIGMTCQVSDVAAVSRGMRRLTRSEEHTSEIPSLMRISYAVFRL